MAERKFTSAFRAFPHAFMVSAALLLVMALVPLYALAHAELTSSSPASGATVAAGLTTITLNFSEEISVDQSNAQLMHADGTSISAVTVAVDRTNRKLETIQTPALSAGKYMVKWHSVTEDDNGITDGLFIFTVAADSGSSSTAPLPTTGDGQDYSLLLGALVIAFCILAVGTMLRRRSWAQNR